MNRKRFISILLSIIMILALLPMQAFAGGGTSIAKGNPTGFGASSGTGKWANNMPQALRISVVFAPYAEGKQVTDNEFNLDFDSPYANLLATFDVTDRDIGDLVKVHSGFNNQYLYYKYGYMATMQEQGGYYGRAWVMKSNFFKDNEGKPMEFPRPVVFGSGTDYKHFFMQDSVLNEIAVMAKSANSSLSWMGKSHLKEGIFQDSYGKQTRGGYILLIETVAYVGLNGKYTAMSLRDELARPDRGFGLSNLPSVLANISNSIHIEDNKYGKFPKLGLKYHPYRQMKTGNDMRNKANHPYMKESQGIGVVYLEGKPSKIPVINYYYNLTPAELQQAGLVVKDGKALKADGTPFTKDDAGNLIQSLNRPADKAKKIDNSNTKYKAHREDENYKLFSGLVTNKTITSGTLNINPKLEGTNGNLPYFEVEGKPQITDKVKEHTENSTLTNPEFKNWKTAHGLVTTIGENNKARKVQGGVIKSAKEGGLEVDFGKGINDLQAVFLYFNYEIPVMNEPPLETQPPEKRISNSCSTPQSPVSGNF